MPRRYLQVALPVPLRKVFDYTIPASFVVPPVVGARVRVPFGSRELIGVILAITEHSETPAERLKPARELLDSEAVLPVVLHELLLWAAHYYQHPVGEVYLSALPILLRQGSSLHENTLYWRLTTTGLQHTADELKRAPKQLQAWQALFEHGTHGMSEDFLLHFAVARDALQALAKKGLAESFDQAITHHGRPALKYAEVALPANDSQQVAIQAITQQLGRFQAILLDGVTGSGKTEVYLQAIAACLQRHQQALVLVPEIGLTPQTVSRFRARFAVDIVMLHSGLTENERLRGWRRASAGHAAIVIGTRSALFTPMPHLGLIVVDEEHDLSFKQQEGFRYHARDLAVLRGQRQQCPVVLGSATPSLETLANAQQGRYVHLMLQQRAANSEPPEIKLIDLRGQKVQEGLTPLLLHAIKQTLARDEQVLLFVNRRGFAPVLLCHDCGWQAKCPRCDARLTLHREPTRLHCHHCTYSETPPRACPDCQSQQLRPIGAGTARIEEALQNLFPKVSVHRIDRDSTRRKDSWQNLYSDIHRGGAALLVGTQMLAKGHHFPNVTLVALLDADGGLLGADFRASERVAQLIMQVAGRAGRAHKAGLVLIQTHQPEHPLLKQLLNGGYPAFAEAALAERQLLQLPPYGHLMLLRAEANAPDLALGFLQAAVNVASTLDLPQPEFWGPVPAPMEKKAGVFRAHLLIKAEQRGLLQRFVAQWLALFANLPEVKRVRWSVDVDMQEMG